MHAVLRVASNTLTWFDGSGAPIVRRDLTPARLETIRALSDRYEKMLANRRPAVASARDQLLRATAAVGSTELRDAAQLERSGEAGPVLQRDWHLPRLWLGPEATA
ncbi:MAG: hypothetical protein ACOYN0_19930 [Phycisphaerales bacterium]